MTARKRAPAPDGGPAPAGVLVAADRTQALVWIRFPDGDEQTAYGFDAAAARDLAAALLRTADEVDSAAYANGGLAVC